MEHLFHADGGILVQVPLYADIDDLCGDKSNPLWDKTYLKSHGDFQGHTTEEISRFFQSWLYFNFLQKFFGGFSKFSLLDFVTRNGNGYLVVTTSKLGYWLIEWFAWVTANYSVQDVQTALYEALDRVFADIYEAAILFCSVGRSAPYRGPVYPGVPEDISLSILVLFSTLEKAATEITARRFHYDIGNSKFLIRLLHQQGWCPTDVEWLSLRNLDTLYSVATLSRPISQVQHDLCQPWKCVAFNVEDESKYEQAHTDDCRGCAPKHIPVVELSGLVDNDRIPLVSFDESAQSLLLKSVSQECAIAYQIVADVAADVTGADGLGNPVANALPVCQLSRLQRLMNNITNSAAPNSPTLWWCDTLCVPARGLADESRNRAIQNMRDVYKGASRVLVLDYFLTNQARDVSAIQAYLYTISSRWMRRLWTFHEAVLAKDIVVQFSDGAARLADLYYAMQNSQSPSKLHSWYDNDCIEALKPFIEGFDMGQSFSIAIYRAVANRNTSRRSDETVCLGNVQGIEIKSILEIPEEDYDGRMREYFRLVHKVPVVLLFQRLPRLVQKGFRWAPTSLLTRFRLSPTSLVYTDHEDMVVDEDGRGVTLQLPGVLINSSHAGYTTGHHFGLTLASSIGSENHFIVYYGPGEAFGEKEYLPEMRTLSAPGLVLCYHTESARFETFDRAVLVNILGNTDGPSFTADYVALVGLRRVPVSVFDAQHRKSQFFTTWRGTNLAKTTNWLIR